jgi:hypothetical protein
MVHWDNFLKMLVELALARLIRDILDFIVKNLLRQMHLAVNILKLIELGIVLVSFNHHAFLSVLNNMGVVAFCF